MFHRAVVSLGSQAGGLQTANAIDLKFDIDRNRRVKAKVIPIEAANYKDIILGIFSGDISGESLFPSLHQLCSEINRLLPVNEQRVSPKSWPPDSFEIDLDEWVLTPSYPILPEGRESHVALARVNYPLVHIRVPMMGPEYIKALSILSSPPTILSEFSNLEEQWYMPDTHEFVDFTLDNSHTFTNT